MKKIDELLQLAVARKGSDLHLTVGLPPVLRINGKLTQLEQYPPLTGQDTAQLANELLDDKHMEHFLQVGEADLSYGIEGLSDFRVNIFKAKGFPAGVIRLIPKVIPSFSELHVPQVVADFSKLPRGLVLVTGPTGSGKSTTLAAMINQINKTRAEHIITLEDPIEYRHEHIRSIINQREVTADTMTFASGLRAALREDPDVILVGEMRDTETIGTAITAAETGHLVLATLHTSSAAQTVDRIIDVFPEHQQAQVRSQLAVTLQGIVAQQLIVNREGDGRCAAFEVLVATPALRNLIREGKTHQIPSYIQTGVQYGMMSMDAALAELVKGGAITKESGLSRCVDQQLFERLLHY